MTDRKMTIHLNPTKVSFVLFFVELIFLNSVSHQLLYSAIYHARRNFLESNPKLFRCTKLMLQLESRFCNSFKVDDKSNMNNIFKFKMNYQTVNHFIISFKVDNSNKIKNE